MRHSLLLRSHWFLIPLITALLHGNLLQADPEKAVGNVTADQPLLERKQLTGNWGGVRSELEDFGVSVFLRDKFETWGNLNGGIRKGIIALNRLDAGLTFDLDKLVGIPNASIYGAFSWSTGGNPSIDLVGDSGDVSGMAASTERTRFAALWYDQTFREKRLRFKGGIIATDDDFMYSEVGQTFLNYEFNGGITSVYLNLNYPSYPIDAPGIFLYGKPTENTYLQFGAYVGSAGQSAPADHGFDFEAGGLAGYSFFLEGGLHYTLAGRAGTAKLGAWYNTGKYAQFYRSSLPPIGAYGLETGEGGYYLIVDQALYTERWDGPKPYTFLKFGWTPHPATSTATTSTSGGLVLEGLIPGREHDRAGLGLSYVTWSKDYTRFQAAQGTNLSSWQTTFEAVYKIHVAEWMEVVPDFQYIINPHISQKNATVLGLHVTVWF